MSAKLTLGDLSLIRYAIMQMEQPDIDTAVELWGKDTVLTKEELQAKICKYKNDKQAEFLDLVNAIRKTMKDKDERSKRGQR